MVSIARKTLLQDKPRFFVSQAGIVFAVSLVGIQTGLLHGFVQSTGTLVDQSEADLWVSAEEMVHLELSLPMPHATVTQVQQIDGVQRAEALTVQGGLWRTPQGELELVRIIGFEPEGQLFSPGVIVEGKRDDLSQPHSIMADVTSLDTLQLAGVGDEAQIGANPANLVGLIEGSQSMVSSAFLFTSLENANVYVDFQLSASIRCRLEEGDFVCDTEYADTRDAQVAGADPADTPATEPQEITSADLVSYVLVKAAPGQDLSQLQQRIQAALPQTQVLTQSEMAHRTRSYWLRRTGIGFVLGLGAVVGVIVGIVVVGQILYALVSDHLKEFGTLKAIGADDRTLYRVIVEQALWMAGMGYGPGLMLCYGVAAWTFNAHGILILITPVTALGLLGLTAGMGVGSALFAIQKVTRIDPVIVFKA
jgi:putative ABC transport system permease protein